MNDSRLTPILRRREAAVHRAKETQSLAALEMIIADLPPPRDFVTALAKPGFHIIAEFKRSSPSLGVIRQNASVADIATAYQRGGATCLSILTEPEEFSGELTDLHTAHQATTLPLLRKDFIIDHYQLAEARAARADGVLLIVAALGPRLESFLAAAADYQLATLVEVHDEAELEIALSVNARLIGVNNRNLATLEIDLATSERLARLIPDDHLWIAESGIDQPADMLRMREAGANGALIGSSLMRASDPGAALAALKNALSNNP